MGNIIAQLSVDKKLKITSETILLSGENLASELIITIPSLFSKYDLYLEFFCGDGFTVSTDKLDLSDEEIVFSLPYEILRHAGKVDFQVIAREGEDIVYKSTVASFEVDESINAIGILEEEFVDVIRSAEQAAESASSAGSSATAAANSAINAAASASAAASSALSAADTANAAANSADTAASNCESKAQAAEEIIENIENAIDRADTATVTATAAASAASSASTIANLSAASADSARESALFAAGSANSAASVATAAAASAGTATSGAVSATSAANSAASAVIAAADAATSASSAATTAADEASSAATAAASAAFTATSAADTATAATNAANLAAASASSSTTAANSAATSANEAAAAANNEVTLMQELYEDVEEALENFTSAYEAAVQGGYEGTEEEFNSALLKVPDCITEEEASSLFTTMGLITPEDQITLRNGSSTALSEEALSGLKVKCADGENDGVIGLDREGRIVAGLSGNTKYYTERYRLMADEAFLIWDNDNKYAYTNNNFKMSHFVRLRITEVMTLVTTNWILEDGIYVYTLTHGYVTEDALVLVNYDDASKAAAVSCGVHNYDPTVSSGTVVIKAASIPSMDLNVKLAVIGGIQWE